MKVTFFRALPLVGLLLVSCAGESARGRGPMAAATAESRGADATPTDASTAAAKSAWQDRKLVRTASLELEVEAVEDAVRAVERIGQEHSALAVDGDTVRDGEGHVRATLRVQVPQDQLGGMLASVRKLGLIRGEHVNTQDVTKAYVDLESRLSARRQAEARLRELMRSATGNLSQVLEVERALDRVLTEIEEMEGERRYYDQATTVSTLTIELSERDAILQASLFAPVGEALRDSVGVLVASLAALVYLVSVVLPWLAVACLGWWVAQRWKRRRPVQPVR